ncbi:putative lanosterol 14-alpha demethylase [Acanthamoeba polyphaga mimivirus]|nr:putative lanosterol 14-alpha demethylase [Mimivirus reunion]WMV62191.1 putative lanosterol 14-alpha demethylase [Mimivirus sp.]WMV63168.1 putative lanosterol 14-alpha demethylase [Acanthamoeba polyphaga mimivirus]WMV64145.1 putative lanosterol 14-alpha demethylase [Mimivirus sp.]
MLFELSIGAIIGFLTLYLLKRFNESKNFITPNNLKKIPIVEGAVPVLGHGPAFSKDIMQFMKNCYEKYGSVFQLKIFRTNMVVLCDRKLSEEFFKSRENDMSLYDVLNRLFFGLAFSDKPDSLEFIIKMVKKTITIRYDDFAPKIMDEAQRLTKIMRESHFGKKLDMIPEIIKFVSRTSARCFIAMDIDDEFYDALNKFTNLLNKIVVLTYFIPHWLLNATLNRFMLRKYRMRMTKLLENEIEKYRTDLNKSDSLLFRKCVDHIDPETGATLTNQDIGDIVVCLLYVSSENTSLLATNCLIDLALNPKYWDLIKSECSAMIALGDYKNLFKAPLLNSIVMESARLNSHVFALARKPKTVNRIGDYFVADNVDTISLCEPALMKFEIASDVYANPNSYDPVRFMAPRNEPKDSGHVMNWGKGVHECPGKQFAIYEVKAAIAYIVTNFERFEFNHNDLKINYFSPSAMCEKNISVEFIPSQQNIHNIVYKDRTYIVEHIKCNETSAWLIYNALDRQQQREYYQYTYEISTDSQEHKLIEKAGPHKPFPIAYDKLVYTGQSNCMTPTKWYDFAADIWELLTENYAELGFPIYDDKIRNFVPNSFYGQLYSVESIMPTHRDQHVDYGLSISIGSNCEFVIEDKTILLPSGSVLIGDFSKISHSVSKIFHEKPDHLSDFEFFNRVRFSAQIRSIDPDVQPLMTTQEFLDMISKY